MNSAHRCILRFYVLVFSSYLFAAWIIILRKKNFILNHFNHIFLGHQIVITVISIWMNEESFWQVKNMHNIQHANKNYSHIGYLVFVFEIHYNPIRFGLKDTVTSSLAHSDCTWHSYTLRFQMNSRKFSLLQNYSDFSMGQTQFSILWCKFLWWN